MKKLAALAGYTEGSCRTIFAGIKKKLADLAAEDRSPNGPVAVTTPKTPASAKKRALEPEDDEETPSKKQKTTSKGKAAGSKKQESAPTNKGRRSKTPKPKKTEDIDPEEEQPLSGPEDYGLNDSILEDTNIKRELFGDEENES